MYRYLPIRDVYAREILDSRGNPTVEVEVLAGENICGRASVPSGASTGQFEAVELRDGDARYLGMGVQKAVDYVNSLIAPEIIGANIFDQTELDAAMIKMDGTKDKSRLGANAILGVSMAVAKTAANALEIPLYRYLGGVNAKTMPVPMMNILNGGKHADNNIDFQEFMIMPVGACCFRDGLKMGTEVYHHLKKLLKADGKATAVGDEGGFAPDFKDVFEVFDYLTRAVESAGYQCGKDIVFAMDVAASELYEKSSGMYYFPGEGELRRTTEEMILLYENICKKYPVKSIEDPLDEEDWRGWQQITERMGHNIQLVGDDLFVTNPSRLSKGIQEHAGNAILVKVNQIGTLTEAFQAIELAKASGYASVISHRSGETEDSMIADIAVAFQTGQIKTGAPCRTERTAKYNQLLRIEEQLQQHAVYQNPFL